MNRNYRVVWSACRRQMVVTHEASSGRGKASRCVRSSAPAAVLAVLSASAVQAWAACPSAVSGLITISTSISSSCSLNTGESITITSGGSVTSSTAVSISGTGTVAGTIVNAGLIHGTADTGIDLYNSATLGAITNTGTIIGYSYGIILSSGTTVTGGVTNTGSIQGQTYGINAEGSLSGGITNSGTIDGGTYGVKADNATLSGGITNAGSIHGGSYAIYVNGTSLSGGVVNSSAGTLTGDYNAIDINTSTVSGGVYNAGHLSGQNSPLLVDDSTLTGGITNAGTIEATFTSYDQAGIDIRGSDVTGGVTNSGLINLTTTSEWAYGISLYSSTLTGSIVNGGTIHVLAPSTSSAYGVRLDGSTISGGVTNTGLITAGDSTNDSGFGIYVGSSTVSGAIVNSGTIQGTGGTVGDGIQVTGSTLSGGITNTGLIQGNTTGISVESSSVGGAIENANGGTITSDGDGIKVDSSSTLTGGIVNAGLIHGGEKSLYLDNASDPFAVNNTGTLEGSVALGINTLNLNGTSGRVIGNTSGTGTVNVNGTFTSEGTFSVGDFNITNDGWFKMRNAVTVSGAAVNDGILDVGSSMRTLTGNYTQSASGTLRFSLSDASTYGSLHVSGNGTVASGAKVYVDVVGAPTLTTGTTVSGVITTGGSLTADASTVSVSDNSAIYNFTAATVSDPGKALDLVIAVDTSGLVRAVDEARLPAAGGAAGALQQMLNTSVPEAMQPVFDRLNNMTSAEAADAVSQTLPTIVGSASQAGINALHSMNKIIQSRVESVQGLSSGDRAADRYMWVRGFGNWSEQDDRGGVSGFDSSTSGIVVGGDVPVSDKVRAGVAFTYARSRIESKSNSAPSKVDVDTFELVGYASQNIDPQTDINYQVDIGKNQASSERLIPFMGSEAKADFDSLALHGSAGIGRVMPIDARTNWTPSVRLDYTVMRTDGYTEDGAGPLNLHVDDQTYREFLLTGDAKVSHQFENGAKLVANASLGYDFINKQAKTTSTFTGGGPAFVTEGLDVAPWFYRLGLGLVKETGKGMEYSLRYDMEARTSGYLNQTVSAKVRWAF